MTEFVETETLHLAYLRQGDRDGWPVVLLHGFPYDVYSFTEVVPQLVRHGAKVLIPYLRGFGPGSFRTAKTFRSGQQAAVGKDLLDFLDALKLLPFRRQTTESCMNCLGAGTLKEICDVKQDAN